MFEVMRDIAFFTTVSVSLIYGTKTAWASGVKCSLEERSETKRQSLSGGIPVAIFLYFFGLFMICSLFMNEWVLIIATSLTSAILISNVVVLMAMPKHKHKKTIKQQTAPLQP